MALSIGGRVSGDFGCRDFVALGARLGLPERAVRSMLDDISRRSDIWRDDLDTLPFSMAQIHKLRRVVTYRLRRLTQ